MPPSSGTEKKSDWLTVSLALMAGTIAALYIGKMSSGMPVIRAALDLNEFEGGLVASILSLTALGVGVFMGTVADVFGHRRILLVGLLTLALGSLLGTFAGDFIPLLVTRFIEGIGFILTVVAAPGLINHATGSTDKAFAFGIWGMYMPAGFAAVVLISPWVFDHWDWETLWAAVGAITLMWALVCLLVIPKPEERPQPSLKNAVDTVSGCLKRLGPWLLSLSFTCYTAQWAAIMIWLPTLLKRGDLSETIPSDWTIAGLTALAVFANAPGNLAGGWLLKRGVARWLLIALTALTMAVSGVLIFAADIPGLWKFIVIVLFSLISGVLPAATLAGAPVFAPTPKQVSTVNGLIVQGSHMGQFIGPPTAGAIATAFGAFDGTVWMMTGASVIMLTFAVMLRGAENRLSS